MAKTKGKAKAKRAGKKRVYKRAAKAQNVPDFGSLSVQRTFTAAGNNPVVNTLYSLMNTTLDQFDRAVQAARAYQHYRIKYISIKIRPTYDTFAQAGGSSKMNLYYMIDKSGSVPTNVTLESLKQMGAKPRALDEKPIVIGWRPSVLTTDMTQGGPAGLVQSSQYKISPWLATNSVPTNNVWNPNSVDHLGCYFYVEQSITPIQTSFEVDVEVQFQFKKPLWTATTGAPAIGLTPAVVNNSVDGIVGGPDGV